MTRAYTRQSDILPLTRYAAALLLPFLVTAGLLLYIWPDRTDQTFAWTIMPRTTALVMGAGYLSGVYFFARALKAERWQAIELGFLPIAVFAWLAGLATVLHWDRFHQDHVSFLAWAALYAITPVLVPGLWVMNRLRQAEATERSWPTIPASLAAATGAAGLAILGTGIALYLLPGALAPAWPWTLSPLTARILGSFFILSGLVDLRIAFNRRWCAVQIALESQLVGMALMLLGFLRSMDTINLASPLAGLLLAGIAILWLALFALYFYMKARVTQAA